MSNLHLETAIYKAERAKNLKQTDIGSIAQAYALIAIAEQLEQVAKELKSINNYLGIMKS